jgi:hypothetical protein
MRKAEPLWFGLSAFRLSGSDGASAADEVHDDRDQSEDEQEVNQETAHVKDEKSAEPE